MWVKIYHLMGDITPLRFRMLSANAKKYPLYRAGSAPGEPVTPPAWAAVMQGSLLAPPRKFGGMLAGAAGTFKKAKEGICLLSRSHPGGGGRGRPF
jgi:hypothetical protein